MNEMHASASDMQRIRPFTQDGGERFCKFLLLLGDGEHQAGSRRADIRWLELLLLPTAELSNPRRSRGALLDKLQVFPGYFNSAETARRLLESQIQSQQEGP